MTARQHLDQVLATLPDPRLQELLDFARFLHVLEQGKKQESWAWQKFGKMGLAKAYGPDEPEYTEADLQVKRKP